MRWQSLVTRRSLHPQQAAFVNSTAKRKVIRAGRRGGKTVGAADLAVKAFLESRRVLYATPTQEQVDSFWFEVKSDLYEAIEAGYLYKNETRHIIEVAGTQNRIRAKTAWNADTLRGDYADLLILDEWQLMHEGTWGDVGAPMLMDNNGDAVFIYTPPSLRSRSVTKADDPRHAAKLFKRAAQDDTGRWATFHFSSQENPFLPNEAFDEVAQDMTRDSYEREILALDKDDVQGALWTQTLIDSTRETSHPTLHRVAVGVDPAGSNTADSDETGIIVAGVGNLNGMAHGYVLQDLTMKGSPNSWASQVVAAYRHHMADIAVAETNNGGDMVIATIETVAGEQRINTKKLTASRGKATRAEPIAALYENGLIHHVGYFPELEDQMRSWVPGMSDSPDRMDALVWCFTELMLGGSGSSLSVSQNVGLYQRRKVPT